jgi:PIN domain nuclease of toxin-antitoxin system
MRLLLDTHALIWFIEGEDSLSYVSLSFIEDPDNQIFVSMTSFYEMAIKLKLGKLDLTTSLKDFFQKTLAQKIMILPISENHVFEYLNVPSFAEHKDPFDRIIIATAICENLDIITIDGKFKNYESLVNIIW